MQQKIYIHIYSFDFEAICIIDITEIVYTGFWKSCLCEADPELEKFSIPSIKWTGSFHHHIITENIR